MAADTPDTTNLTVSSNGGSRPVPDPTALTDAAIAKAIASMRDYIDGQLGIRDERLAGIDEATKLRLSTVGEIPAAIEEKVGRLGDVVTEKFSSIQIQFKERDTRSENEKRDSQKAVDAAFAAQKEQAAAENKSNREAIDKSEKATTETIKTNQELNATKTDNITKDLDGLKLAVNSILASGVGRVEQRGEARESRGAMYATVGLIVTVVLAAITILAAIAALKPGPA